MDRGLKPLEKVLKEAGSIDDPDTIVWIVQATNEGLGSDRVWTAWQTVVKHAKDVRKVNIKAVRVPVDS